MTKVKRLHEYDELHKQAILYLYDRVKDVPKDGKVRTFEGEMKYREVKYHVKIDFRNEADFVTVWNVLVEHAAEVIQIPQIVH